jgi:hypothetical protein
MILGLIWLSQMAQLRVSAYAPFRFPKVAAADYTTYTLSWSKPALRSKVDNLYVHVGCRSAPCRRDLAASGPGDRRQRTPYREPSAANTYTPPARTRHPMLRGSESRRRGVGGGVRPILP